VHARGRGGEKGRDSEVFARESGHARGCKQWLALHISMQACTRVPVRASMKEMHAANEGEEGPIRLMREVALRSPGL